MIPSEQSVLDSRLQRVNDALSQLFLSCDKPVVLYEAARYVLASGGKRIRPLLTLVAADLAGSFTDDAIHAAVAMEVFHNFTLVHDDIMDRSEMRRGSETVHKKWDEPTAILCGDLLLGVAYEELCRCSVERYPPMLTLMNATVRTLCEGQVLDMEFETRNSVSVAEYLCMIEKKTAALLETSLIMGGLSAGASDETLQKLKMLGWHMGLAFQLSDDLLDVSATDDRWGKLTGGDLRAAKKTYILLRAIDVEASQNQSFFAEIDKRGGMPESDFPEAVRRLDRLGVLSETKKKIEAHLDEAGAIGAEFSEGASKNALENLIQSMRHRSH